MLLIFPQETPFHVIGMPALIGYYTIHDMEKSRIGFAPHSESKKSKLQKGPAPTKSLAGINATEQATGEVIAQEKM